MKVTGDAKSGYGFEFQGKDIKELDEIFIGNWLHLERMDGVNKRTWCLIIGGDKGALCITITENNGQVSKAFIFENEWESSIDDAREYLKKVRKERERGKK
jgi:hypothetical protein